MIVVEPISISFGDITTNLVDPNAEWTNLLNFAIGVRCKVTTTANGASEATYKVYEAAAASGPANGGALDPTDRTNNADEWIQVSSINELKPFDQVISDQAERVDSISMVAAISDTMNLVGILNANAATAIVTMTHPVDGEVYANEVSFVQDVASEYWDWCFKPPTRKTNLVLDDLPAYSGVDIGVELVDTGSIAKVGEIVFGLMEDIGQAQWGTSIGILDFSTKKQDDFGQYIIVQRPYSKTIDFDWVVESDDVELIDDFLSSRRTTPMLWMGLTGDNKYGTIAYGFYKTYKIFLSNPSFSRGVIKVEGFS